jgi:hypothetical protein
LRLFELVVDRAEQFDVVVGVFGLDLVLDDYALHGLLLRWLMCWAAQGVGGWTGRVKLPTAGMVLVV